ncbi:uncharacterized protein A4U43_C04F16060 [Asparagus officinalis]|uniref:Uncharacterized protein n=1 Tax=Asparagus officinalis TaxID=4686 RepID=A0A5P1F5X8_ASPOF|nr:uncharacterized protein A4U43_C04F16060 [Asparagus officinalis]
MRWEEQKWDPVFLAEERGIAGKGRDEGRGCPLCPRAARAARGSPINPGAVSEKKNQGKWLLHMLPEARRAASSSSCCRLAISVAHGLQILPLLATARAQARRPSVCVLHQHMQDPSSAVSSRLHRVNSDGHSPSTVMPQQPPVYNSSTSTVEAL